MDLPDEPYIFERVHIGARKAVAVINYETCHDIANAVDAAFAEKGRALDDTLPETYHCIRFEDLDTYLREKLLGSLNPLVIVNIAHNFFSIARQFNARFFEMDHVGDVYALRNRHK